MLKSAKDYASASLQKAVNKALLSPEDAAKSIARLETTADFATAVNTSDFIIEAVPEKMDLKLDVFDLVGLDTRLNILNFLHSTLGEKFRPCPLLVKYVKAGRLGKKVGRGVYEYDQNRK